MDSYEPGELFVYTNGDRWELGQVKRAHPDGKHYFCWYSKGDTAASTPVRNMHKLANAGWSHIDRELWYKPTNSEVECRECGLIMDLDDAIGMGACPNCGEA